MKCSDCVQFSHCMERTRDYICREFKKREPKQTKSKKDEKPIKSKMIQNERNVS